MPELVEHPDATRPAAHEFRGRSGISLFNSTDFRDNCRGERVVLLGVNLRDIASAMSQRDLCGFQTKLFSHAGCECVT